MTDTVEREREAHWYDPGAGAPTPWGPADGRWEHAKGVNFYSTPGHGGFKVNAPLNALIPDWAKPDTYAPNSDGWYEENCEWSIVATFLPGAFDHAERKLAEATLRHTYPEIWERFYGRELEPGESSQKDEQTRKAQAEAEGRYLVLSAWGDWCDTVPEGHVGVLTSVGGRRGDGAVRMYVLIPRDEYNNPRDIAILPGDYPTWVGPHG